MPIQVSQLTDKGLVRLCNEDSIKSFNFDIGEQLAQCLVVADGIGGHQAGDVASKTAVSTLETVLPTLLKSQEDVQLAIKRAIQEVNTQVYEKAQAHIEMQGMGTTLTLGVFIKDQLIIGHVGDSRAYLYRSHTLQCLTDDHSLVGELVRQGELSREEARLHPRRNIILKAVGTDANVEPDIYWLDLKENDILIFCTDGLTDLIKEDELAAIIEQNPITEDVLHIFLKLVKNRGAHDNVSMIMAHWLDD